MKNVILSLLAAVSLAATAARAEATAFAPDTQPGADQVWVKCTVTDQQTSKDCRFYGGVQDEKDRYKAGSILGYLDAHPVPIPGGPVGADATLLVRLKLTEVPERGYAIAAPEGALKPVSGQDLNDPIWIYSPYDQWAEGFIPEKAYNSKMKGEAKAVCKVLASGALVDCWAEHEEPKGWGFGEAALRVLAHARMKPIGASGQPVADRPIAINVKFNPRDVIQVCDANGAKMVCRLD